jgi:hypothetical protein
MTATPAEPTGTPGPCLTTKDSSPRAGQAVTSRDVRAALAMLSAEQRRVVVEIYYHHRSVADTADMLRIHPAKVTSMAYSAVRWLPRALASRKLLWPVAASADGSSAASAPARPAGERRAPSGSAERLADRIGRAAGF